MYERGEKRVKKKKKFEGREEKNKENSLKKMDKMEVQTFVPGLVDSRKGQVPILPHLAADIRPIGDDGRISCVREAFALGVPDGKRCALAADPVARKVAIAVHQRDLGARVEEAGEVGEEAGAGVVAGEFEGGGDAGGGAGVVDGDAEGGLDPVLAEEADEVGRGEGVFLGVGYVVPGALWLDFEILCAENEGGGEGRKDARTSTRSRYGLKSASSQ